MKNHKLLVICGAVLLIGTVMTGCASMRLDYLEADTVDGPKQVRQGQDINPRDITVWGIYKDGSRKVVAIGNGSINFNKSTPGPQTVKVRVGVLTSQEVSFQTNVMALRSISVASQPKTTLFKAGQIPDSSWPGLEIRGEWDQMGSDKIDLKYCEITGYMKDQAGKQTLTVVYEGLQTTFNVDVRSMTSLQVAQPPTKLEYLQGDNLDLAGLKVVGVWEGFPAEDIAVTINDITGYSPNNVGIQHVTITKNGKIATFDVNVLGLTGLNITVFPTKRVYQFGEELDLSGIEVEGNYTGGLMTVSRKEPIPFEKISYTNYNPKLISTQVVTIRVEGSAANVTTAFDVEVVMPK